MKKLRLAISLIIAIVLLCACAPQTGGEQGSNYEVTITDVLEREVSVRGEPERIVSLSPALTEMIFAIGAGDRLVGVDQYSDYPEAVNKIEKVGDFITPDTERILALEPDLVIAGNKLQIDTVETLAGLGLNVAALEATDIDSIYNSVELLGELLDEKAKAEVLRDEMDSKLNDVLSSLSDDKRPTVYYVMSFGESGNWTAGPGSFIYELMELAGGICITSDMPVPWVDFSLEELVARDPEVLLVSSYLPMDQLMQSPGYMELSAVKNGRVFTVNEDLISRPGPRIFDALKEIRDALE